MTEYVNSFTIFVVSVAGAGIGAYGGAYLREKGKNLATHEDIEKIVAQLRKTTEAAEDIKAQISGELWLGQIRWQLKRELYVNLLEGLADSRAGLRSMNGIMERRRTATEEPVRQRLSEDLRRAALRYEEAVARVRRARAVSGILLGDEAQRVA